MEAPHIFSDLQCSSPGDWSWSSTPGIAGALEDGVAFQAAVADEERHVLHDGCGGDLHLAQRGTGMTTGPASGWLILMFKNFSK